MNAQDIQNRIFPSENYMRNTGITAINSWLSTFLCMEVKLYFFHTTEYATAKRKKNHNSTVKYKDHFISIVSIQKRILKAYSTNDIEKYVTFNLNTVAA